MDCIVRVTLDNAYLCPQVFHHEGAFFRMRHLLVIQFPFADVRRIIGLEKTHHLISPTWPQPVIRRQFIRNFGQVRTLNGFLNEGIWPGNDVFCEAKHALKLPILGQIFKGKAAVWVSRRFFSNGMEVCWYEINFSIQMDDALQGDAYQDTFETLVQQLLNSNIHLSQPAGDPLQIPLIEAGEELAKRYLYQSTKAKAPPPEKWWVKAGEPVVLLTAPEHFRPSDITPNAIRSADFSSLGVPDIYYYRPITQRDWPYSSWRLLQSSILEFSDQLPSLRSNILRLHVEKECLKSILSDVAGFRFSTERGHPESEGLQQYLSYILNKLHSGHEEALENNAIVEKIFQLDSIATKADRRKIKQQLQNIRRGLYANLGAFLDQLPDVESA